MDFKNKKKLQNAIIEGRLDDLKKTVKDGFNLLEADDHNTSILTLSAYTEQWSIFDYLLEQGLPAHVHAQDKTFVLAALAISGQQNRLKTFLQEQGRHSLNYRDNHNASALIIALQHKKFSVAIDLINAGIDINAHDQDGDTALTLIINHVQKHPIEAYNVFNLILSQKNVDIDQKGYQGATALNTAAKLREMPMVKSLLKAGANPNILNNKEESALWYAVTNLDKEMSEILFDQGADINQRSKSHSNNTLVHHMLTLGYQDWVKYLCQKPGVKLNLLNDLQFTPLGYTARGGHHTMAKHLLEAGADPDKIIFSKLTALDIARLNKHQNIVDLIRHSKAQKHHTKSRLGQQFQKSLKQQINKNRKDKNKLNLKRRPTRSYR